MFRKPLCAVLTLCVMAGCSKQDDYKAESVKLCHAFDFASWQLQPKDIEPDDVMQTLKQKIWSGVKSRKLSKIISATPDMPREKRYQYISSEIEKLTGEMFECPEMEAFFGPLAFSSE